jgi:serine/threonine protein kinase
MEFVDGDTLNQKIQKTRMNENEIRFYLVEMISVLEYLHSNNIVYRYVK